MKKTGFIILSLTLIMVMAAICQEPVQSLRVSPVVSVVQNVGPAVVNISTEKVVATREFSPFGDRRIFEYFQPYKRRNVTRQTLGSGVIIREDGIVLTNEHVILPASKITVTMENGREFEAELLGASRRFDLALLKINATDPLPFVPCGSSEDLMIGETVIAIGNPFGLASTVTTGVISAINRTVTFQDSETRHTQTYNDFIQTDASINPGNSGGPLLNILGELVGINTAIFADADGIGFTIPIDKARRVIDDLLTTGDVPRIWLGVLVQNLTPALARHLKFPVNQGVLISEIRKDSPGWIAGLRRGDLIVRVDGQAVINPSEYRERIRDYTPGDKIPMEIYRKREEMVLDVYGEEIPLERSRDLAWDLIGMQVSDLSANLVKKYRIQMERGVVAINVRRGSPAEDVGIKKGDVIIQLDRTQIGGSDHFYEGFRRSLHRDSITLVIIRGANAYRVTLTIQ